MNTKKIRKKCVGSSTIAQNVVDGRIDCWRPRKAKNGQVHMHYVFFRVNNNSMGCGFIYYCFLF